VRGGVQLGPLGTTATNRPIAPAPGDYDGEIDGIIGKGNRSTRRKPAPVPLCPPQTPHAAWTRTWAAAVGRQRLTAWAMARPEVKSKSQLCYDRRSAGSLSWCQVPIWDLRPAFFISVKTVAGLLMWGAHSHERMDFLQCTILHDFIRELASDILKMFKNMLNLELTSWLLNTYSQFWFLRCDGQYSSTFEFLLGS
jgi:hypothetical protein